MLFCCSALGVSRATGDGPDGQNGRCRFGIESLFRFRVDAISVEGEGVEARKACCCTTIVAIVVVCSGSRAYRIDSRGTTRAMQTDQSHKKSSVKNKSRRYDTRIEIKNSRVTQGSFVLRLKRVPKPFMLA